MELWQMDVMGGVRLSDGTELKVVTGIDDHSRFCVSAMVVRRATARPVCDALGQAMRTHGVPDQILTDNGKVFTGRFGPGTGVVLFDRICRENGIRHLLTAPRSPTTTGKVERFHKTVRKDFLEGRVFEPLEEAQAALDRWVEHYNCERPHQGIGMIPPIRRFELAVSEPLQLITSSEEGDEQEQIPEPGLRAAPVVSRRVGGGGKISLATFKYYVGRWLEGETVEVAISAEGLIEVTHRGVLVATHVRQHPVESEPRVWRREPRSRPARPETMGRPVIRKVDSSGNVSFAPFTYRVGHRFRRQQVEVRVTGNTVEISQKGRVIRTHPIRHDPTRLTEPSPNPEAKPTGSTPPAKPARICRVGGGAKVSPGYRDLTIITYRDQPALNTPMTIEELATSPGHGLARYFPYKEEAGGSSPSTPTTESLATAGLSSFPEL